MKSEEIRFWIQLGFGVRINKKLKYQKVTNSLIKCLTMKLACCVTIGDLIHPCSEFYEKSARNSKIIENIGMGYCK